MGYSKNRPFVKVDVTGEVDKRFDEVTSQLAQIPQQITNAVKPKADITYVDMKTQANNIAWKESFDTLASLETKYPTGDSYNHAVLETGEIYKIYTWVTGTWINTNVQANGTGIANGSVTFDKLGSDVVGQIEVGLENFENNGDFSNGISEWSAYYGTASLIDGRIRMTPSGGHIAPYLYKVIVGVPDHKFYYRAKMRSNTPNLHTLYIQHNNAQNIVLKDNIVQGEWNNLSGIAEYVINGYTLTLRGIYDSAETSLNATFDADDLLYVDLTAYFGVGNEPDKETMDKIVDKIPNQWWSGNIGINTAVKSLLSNTKDNTPTDYKNVVTADFTTNTFDVVGKRNKEQDYTFAFKPYGVNNIVGINAIYKSNNDTRNPSINKNTLLLSTGSDWISPYKIKALSNGDTTIAGDEWTGGTHGTTGSSGIPTARTNEVRLFVDGQEKTTDGTYYGDDIEIIVINDIEGYNTHNNQRYIVEERIKYRVVGTKIDMQGTILIKEDAELKTYYAMQTPSGYYDEVKYLDSANENWLDTTINTDSGVKSTYPLPDTRILNKSTTQEQIVVWFDNFYGLGVRDYLLPTQSLLATYSYGAEGKTYTHLLVENPINFNAGDILHWQGYYWFK